MKNLMTPEQRAWMDWRQEGAFFASEIGGHESRMRYLAEAKRIEREQSR